LLFPLRFPLRAAKGYNKDIMVAPIHNSDAIQEICDNVKGLGFRTGERIRMYGEQLEVVSDPFLESDGIAVHVKQTQSTQPRVLRLPATILQAVKGRLPRTA
jgi:hypothetical protein